MVGAEVDYSKLPRKSTLLSHIQNSIAEVFYWYKTGDWPVRTKARHQSPKVKLVLRLIIQAEVEAERKQMVRHDMIIRALGSKGI